MVSAETPSELLLQCHRRVSGRTQRVESMQAAMRGFAPKWLKLKNILNVL
jgi:hypothetical protein